MIGDNYKIIYSKKNEYNYKNIVKEKNPNRTMTI